MNTKTASPRVAACSVPLAGSGSRLQILPAGQFRAADGRPADAPHWELPDSAAAALVAQLNSRAVRLMVDYEHQTLLSADNGRPNPAAGWLSNFVWEAGRGLFADVQWTAAAKQMIEQGEYRYLSPVFNYAPSGAVLSLLPPALTNTPALDVLDPVALSAAARLLNPNPPEEKPMNEALKQVLSLLGLPETATEAEQLAAVQQIKDAAKGKKLAEALAAAQGEAESQDGRDGDKGGSRDAGQNGQTGQQAGENPTGGSANPAPADNGQTVPLSVLQGLQQQVAALSQTIAQQEAEKTGKLITAALSDGRLLPAQKSWAESLGKSNPQALAEFLNTAQPIAALTAQQSAGLTPAAAAGGLTAEEAQVARQLGISADDFAKSKQE